MTGNGEDTSVLRTRELRKQYGREAKPGPRGGRGRSGRETSIPALVGTRVPASRVLQAETA